MRLRFIATIAWAAVIPLALFLEAYGHLRPALLLAGLASTAYGLSLFLCHGGAQITCAGVYSASLAVFSGYPAAHIAVNDPQGVTRSLLYASLLVYSSHIAMVEIFWRTSVNRFRPVQQKISATTARWLLKMGISCLALSAVLRGPTLGALPPAVGFVGAAMITISILNGGHHLSRLRLLLAGGVVLLYAAIFFNGDGRLTLVGVLLIAAAATSARFARTKPIIVVGFVIVLGALLALQARPADRKGGAVVASLGGIGSAVEPLPTFARLLERGQQPHWGNTFVAASVAQVPGSLWSGKPEGFGRVLTRELAPEQLRTGQSLAALSAGEWFYNFGYAGIALSVIVLGWLVRTIDRRLAMWAVRPRVGLRESLRYLGVLVLVAGSPELFWVGSFTFSARAGTQLVIIAGLLFSASATRKSPQSRTSIALPPPARPTRPLRSYGLKGAHPAPPKRLAASPQGPPSTTRIRPSR